MKVFAFIDSQNLHLGVKNQGWELDFAKFRIYLQDKYLVQRAYLFIGYVKGNEALYATLQEAGFVLIFKPTLEYRKDSEKHTKGNVDAELVLHAMIQHPEYEKAVIVTGDGDFHCLIEYLESQKKLSKLIVPNKRYSSLLRKFAPFIVQISSFRKKVEK